MRTLLAIAILGATVSCAAPAETSKEPLPVHPDANEQPVWPASLCAELEIDPVNAEAVETLGPVSFVVNARPLSTPSLIAALREHRATLTACRCQFEPASAFELALVDVRAKHDLHRIDWVDSKAREIYVASWFDDGLHAAWFENDGTRTTCIGSWTLDGAARDEAMARKPPDVMTGAVTDYVHIPNAVVGGVSEPLKRQRTVEIWSWNGEASADVAEMHSTKGGISMGMSGKVPASYNLPKSVAEWPNPTLALIAMPLEAAKTHTEYLPAHPR